MNIKKIIKKPIKLALKICDYIILKIIFFIRLFIVKNKKRTAEHYLLLDCSFIIATNMNNGIQRVIRNTVKNISSCVSNGTEIIPVQINDGVLRTVSIEDVLIGKSCTCAAAPSAIIGRISQKLLMYKSLFDRNILFNEKDVLLLLDATWHMNIWSTVAELRKSGVTIVGVCYDLIPLRYSGFCESVFINHFRNWYSNSFRYCNGYIAISKTVINDLKQYMAESGMDVSSYRFDYFKMGADFKLTTQAQAMATDDIAGIFSDHSTYLTVSTIEPRKNHVFILDEMEKLWDAGIDVRWVIVGRIGWKTDELIERIKNHKEYCRRLFMFNNMDDAGLAYCYTHAKALIFASIIEGYGLPIVESLKMGLPVLASDTEIHREVGGENAVYFSIEKPGTLSSLVADIENGKHELKHINTDRIHITTWKESAEDLVTKIKKMAEYEKQR